MILVEDPTFLDVHLNFDAIILDNGAHPRTLDDGLL
jgi:hypothetical protein